jgi:hypothetical protein
LSEVAKTSILRTGLPTPTSSLSTGYRPRAAGRYRGSDLVLGLMCDLRTLWQEGIGRLAAVYVVSLFGFVVWVGLLISWIFFAGLKPPIAG